MHATSRAPPHRAGSIRPEEARCEPVTGTAAVLTARCRSRVGGCGRSAVAIGMVPRLRQTTQRRNPVRPLPGSADRNACRSRLPARCRRITLPSRRRRTPPRRPSTPDTSREGRRDGYARSAPEPTAWAKAVSRTAKSWAVSSDTQSRNDERKPWIVPAMFRTVRASPIYDRARPVRSETNTSPPLCSPRRAPPAPETLGRGQAARVGRGHADRRRCPSDTGVTTTRLPDADTTATSAADAAPPWVSGSASGSRNQLMYP